MTALDTRPPAGRGLPTPMLDRAAATELVDALATLDVPLAGATVVVVSGSFGAGHDSAAAQVVDRLHRVGARTRTLDVVDLFPARTGRLVRWAYPRLLRWCPPGWALILALLTPGTAFHRAIGAMLGRLGGRLAAMVSDADLVVSTHPFASQALGCQRLAGRLSAPVATYLTDASAHALWVHRGVDLHLALHRVAAAQTTSLLAADTGGPLTGAAGAQGSRVCLVRALTPADDAGLDPWAAVQLRRSLGLANQTPLVLVVGGSLGVGRLRRAARDLRDTGCGVPVVVCGRNRALRRRLGREPGVVALGWRTDLPDLIRAADCVVQNAGGFTAWESLAAGTPVVTYRAISGHGETNAAALAGDGLVPWPRTAADLQTVVSGAVSTRRLAGALPTAS